MIPPQRQHGVGQEIRSGLVVVSPHVKQIHALLRMRSSGPTNRSGKPRRSMSSRSFMPDGVGARSQIHNSLRSSR